MSRETIFGQAISILLIGGGFIFSFAGPMPPSLSTPADAAKNQTTTPTLSWSAVSGATSYHVQVSASQDFSTTVYDQNNVTGTSQSIGSGLAASIINIGTPVNYDNQGGRFGDNQRTMIRMANGKFRSFDGAGHYIVEGTIADPVASYVGNFSWSWNGITGHELSWIMAAYNPGGDTLIGQVHMEDNGQTTYAVGLAMSTDFGSAWTYLGDVATPGTSRNVGGGMMIMINGYLYMYYNGSGINVARSPIDSVMIVARQKKVTTWMKYANGTWTTSAISGTGTRTFSGDGHGGATVVKSTGTVLAIPNSGVNTATTTFYASTDGLTSYQTFAINTPGSVYGSFAGTAASGTRTDHFEVGDSFYVFWDNKANGDYNNDHFYRAPVAVYPKNYHWRVSASDASGAGAWSDARVFTTQATIQSGTVTGVEGAPSRSSVQQESTARLQRINTGRWLLTYTTTGTSPVRIVVHDLRGRVVRTLLLANVNPGTQTAELNMQSLSAGQYVIGVQAGSGAHSIPFVLSK